MVALHGGNINTLDHTDQLPHASIEQTLTAKRDGIIAAVNADRIGRAVLLLGGGRSQTTDTIDPAVGITHLCKVGSPIRSGEPLLKIHANSQETLEAAKQLALQGISIADTPPQPHALIVETIRPKDL